MPLVFSPSLWLPPVMPDEADRITTHVTVSVDIFLVSGTWPGNSYEVQHVDILPRFVPDQCLPFSLHREIFLSLYPRHVSHGGIDISFLLSSTPWLFEGRK